MAVTADQVIVELEAKVAQYTRDVQAAREKFDRNMEGIRRSAVRSEQGVNRSFDSAGRGAQRFSGVVERSMTRADAAMNRIAVRVGALAGTFAAVLVTRGLNSAVSQLDEIAKTADKIGVTTTALQELRSAAGQSGVDLGALDSSLVAFNRRIGEAAKGVGDSAKAFREYGIDVKDAQGNTRPMEAILADVAELFSRTSDTSERTRIAFRLMGRQGIELVNMLSGGADAFNAMRARAHEFNGVIGEDSVRAGELLRNEIDLLTNAIGNNFTNAVGRAAVILNEFFNIGKENQLAFNVQELERVRDEIAKLSAPRPEGGIGGFISGMLAPGIDRRLAELREAESRLLAENEKLALQFRPSFSIGGEDEEAGTTRTGGGKKGPRTDDSARAAAEAIRDRIELMTQELSVIGLSDAARVRETASFERQRTVRELLEAAQKEGATITAEEIELAVAHAAEIEALTIAIDEKSRAVKDAADAAREAAQAEEALKRNISDVTNRFADAIQRANSFADALRNIAVEIANLAIQGIGGSGPLGGILGKIIPTLVGGLIGGSVGGFPTSVSGGASTNFTFGAGDVLSTFSFNALGGVESATGARPLRRFGTGGISDRTAIFGEGGLPEAAVPLPDGRQIPVDLRVPRLDQRAAASSTEGPITIVNQIDARGAQKGVAEEIADALEKYDRRLPGRIREAKQRGMV